MTQAYDRRWGEVMKNAERRIQDVIRLASISHRMFDDLVFERLQDADEEGMQTMLLHKETEDDLSWVLSLMTRFTRELDDKLTEAHNEACKAEGFK